MKSQKNESVASQHDEGIGVGGDNQAQDGREDQCSNCLSEFDRGVGFGIAMVRAKIFDCNSLAELETVLEKAVRTARFQNETITLPPE